MMVLQITSIALLAFAVSLDSFGVGITYGLRKIHIPFLSIIIISFCSGGVIWLSMKAGVFLLPYIPEKVTTLLGASILILIGIWALFQYFRQSRNEQHEQEMSPATSTKEDSAVDIGEVTLHSTSTVLILELKRLGLVIQILKTPQTADFDRSGSISASEAVMLGIALSLDAFGAGLGASILGLSITATVFSITICSAIFVVAGTILGRKLSHLSMMKYFSGLPGVLLIILGLIKLF